MLQTMLSITSAILFVAALAYTPQQAPAYDSGPGCIVQPDVIEACVNGGGRFDFQSCSCVGGEIQ